jgi:YVTN family beta-propeller protein
VHRIDPRQNLLGAPLQLPRTSAPVGDAAARVGGAKSVWASSTSAVSRLEPSPAFTIPLRRFACCAAIAVGEGAVWATQQFGVLRIDPGGRLLTPIKLPFASSSIAAGLGGVWIVDSDENRIWRIDPRTNAVSTTITVGSHPAAVATGAGSVWVAGTNGVVSRIDPRTNLVVERIPVGHTPRGIAFGYGRVWTTVD